ncbi:MAG: thiamine diphosphokinase [Anaerolineae bacterium]|nr:thiamine diphosphokinase [Anaerolineae bacterium]
MRALIFANGIITDYAACLSHIQPDDVVICADGGTRHALALGLHPDLIVGDLDSFPDDQRATLEASGTRFLVYPARKDQTDLELALIAAQEAGITSAHLMGVLGGRLDQTVANLLLLAQERWATISLSLSEGAEEAWVTRDQTVIVGAPGDTVSLIALTPEVQGIYTEGLEYALSDGRLIFGSTLGISNVMLSQQASVRLRSGTLLVVHGPGSTSG